ncbi:MAG TPA: hypothetical protein VM052_04500, partial [Candidatus Limnocylindrales bacterium]|nr:hypothetical protein [Candidatus Limnocylindrales bacterium]
GIEWIPTESPVFSVSVSSRAEGLHAAYLAPQFFQRAVAPGYAYWPAIDVVNDGSSAWSIVSPIHCSYHLYTGNGQLVVWDGARAKIGLPSGTRDSRIYGPNLPVQTGQTASCGFFDFVAPWEPGTYIVEWDMVYEGSFWFSERGVTPRRDTFTVLPPAS